MTAEIVLAVDGVSKSFGALAALSDVSFDVRAGEVFSVIGPNGAGKSTLFNVIAGLHVPTSGRIVFGGGIRDALGQNLVGVHPIVALRLGLDHVEQREQPGPVLRVRLGDRVHQLKVGRISTLTPVATGTSLASVSASSRSLVVTGATAAAVGASVAPLLTAASMTADARS